MYQFYTQVFVLARYSVRGCAWLESRVEWNGFIPSSSDGMVSSYAWLEGRSGSISMFGWRLKWMRQQIG
jgi:hypothetical protein